MATFSNEKILKKITAITILVIVIALIIANFQSLTNFLFKKEEKIAHLKTNRTTQITEDRSLSSDKQNPLLLAEIFIDEQNNASFIKIFNFSNRVINLQNYSIKKISTAKSYNTLVSQKRLHNITLPPFSYLTISKENSSINGEIKWPKSYSIADAIGIAIFYQNQNVDQVIWNKKVKNMYLKRIKWKDNAFAYLPFY